MRSSFRVGGALLVGAVLIGGAFYVDRQGSAEVASATSALVVADGDVRITQQTLDSDQDGVPDWEEELRGSDPRTYTTFTTPTTTPAELEEPYTEPTTVTDRFAIDFFEDLMRTGAGRDMSEEEKAELVADAVKNLSKETSDTLYERAHIKITAREDTTTLRDYGNAVGRIILQHSIDNENEMVIIQRALDTNNPSELDALQPIVDVYTKIVLDLLALEVPQVLAQEHLDVVNTMSMVRTDIIAMQQTFVDPIPALMRVQRYENDALGMYYALDNVRLALESRSIAYGMEEPGYFLFNLLP